MTFKNKDTGEFGLLIGGVDMRIGSDLLKACTVIENTHMLAPTVNLTFVDDKKRASTFGAYADGAGMSIIIGDGKTEPYQYKFRSFSIEQGTTNSAGNLVTVNGVADIMPWMRKTIDKSYKMTASQVVQQLASRSGLLTDIDSTSDSQAWLPDNRSFGQFARRIIDHAWMGEGASPFLAVTSQAGQWLARVKDALKFQPSGKQLVSMGLAGPTDYMVLDYTISSKAGALNSLTNYGSQVIQEALTGDVDIISAMTFAKGVSAMGINSGLAGALGNVLNTYMPPDVGNTHKNYTRAMHNNRKARASFTTTVMAVTDRLTTYKLLDDAKIILAMFDGTIDVAYSGTYKVTAIARHVSKGAFMEKLELSSQGQNVDVWGQGK